MKIGVGSFAFRWSVGAESFRPPAPMSLLDLLKTSAEYGAEVVQICDNLPLESYSPAALDEVKTYARRLDLELELGIKARDAVDIERHLAVCQGIGSGLVRVVLVGQCSLTDATDMLRGLIPELEARSLRLAIENHFRFTPIELAKMVETIAHPRIGICLDPLNSISHLMGPREVFAHLIPHTLTVHVKDAVAKRQGTGFYIAGCPIGAGLVDFQHLVTALKRQGKTPNILVESWMDRCQTTTQTLAQEHEWVRRDIQTLRSYL